MAGFFPIFFKKYWSHGLDPTESTWWLGVANSSSSLVLALLAPFLGSVADQGGRKKSFLLGFALLGILFSAGLMFVELGNYSLAIVFYALATIGFAGGNIFYDSLIVDVSPPSKFHMVSGLGYSLGYLGGGLLFALNVMMTLKPAWFGFSDPAQAIRASFLTVAIWWSAFSLPLFLFVHEKSERATAKHPWRAGWRVLLNTLTRMVQIRPLLLFFIAYLFYIDGVNTTVKMAVDYGMSIGFSSDNLIVALLVVQFVGFPAAVAFGWFGEKIGPKTGVYVCLGVYIAVIIGAYFMQTTAHFYIMAIAIGLVQGGVQSLSRSLYAHMIPAKHSAEFFGFFNMVGKFSAVLGPFLVGFVSTTTGSSRLSILVLLVFFIIGGALLAKVDPDYKVDIAINH